MITVLNTIDTGHEDMIHDAELDYYGLRLATCSSDNSVKIYDIKSGTQTLAADLKGHFGPVWQVAWAHPKFGNLLASCSYDRKVIIWKESGEWTKLYEYTGHESSVNSVAWAPAEYGLILACCSSDGSISTITYAQDGGNWDVKKIPGAHAIGVNSISWCPAISADLNLDPLSNKEAPKRIVSGGCDNLIKIWREQGDQWVEENRLEMHMDWVRDVAWAPSLGLQRSMIASCSQDKRVVIWTSDDNVSWTPTILNTFDDVVWSVSWSLTGNILAVSGGDNKVSLWREGTDGQWLCISEVAKGLGQTPNDERSIAPEEKPTGVSQTVNREYVPVANRKKNKLSSRQRRKLKQRQLAANAVPAPSTLQHTEKTLLSPGECNKLLAQETVCRGLAVGSQSPGSAHLESTKQAHTAVKRTYPDNNTAPRGENKRSFVDKPNAVPAPSPLQHTEKTQRSPGECNKPLAPETVCQGLAVGSQSPGDAHLESTKEAQASAKRTHPDNNTAPRGENKRPWVEKPAKINPPRSYDDPSNVVAITLAEADFLDKKQSHQIIKILQDVILRLAREQPAGALGPQFRGKPFYNGWSLQLWCMDARTRCWLKNTIEDIKLPSGERLTTKRLSEMQRMVRSGILIPGIHKAGNIPLMLACQNPWAGVDRWMFHVTTKQGKNTFLLVGIPEDVVKVLMKCERRLGFMLGSVYVKFQGSNKKFSNVPPKLSMDDEDEDYRTSTTNNYTDANPKTSELEAYATPNTIRIINTNTSAEAEASTTPHHYLNKASTKSHHYLNEASPTYLNEVSSTSHHSLKEASSASQNCLNEASTTSRYYLNEATISRHYVNEASVISHHCLNEASTKSHHYLNETSTKYHPHVNEASTKYHHYLKEASPTSPHYVNEASTKSHHYLNAASPTSHHNVNEASSKSHHYINEASTKSRHYLNEASTKYDNYLNEASPTSHHCVNEASMKSRHYLNEASTKYDNYLDEASNISHHCVNEASTKSRHYLNEAYTKYDTYLDEASTKSHHYLNAASPTSHHYVNDASTKSHHYLNEASTKSHNYLNEASPSSHHFGNEASTKSHHYVNKAFTKSHHHLNEASPTSHHYINETSATPLDGMPDSADEYTYENLESPDGCDWDSWYEED